ncbi:MAG: DUF2723 domain-containing protein [Deltaproteobacteria bacterium]|nr:DUF2723 domain-containing protein [Deltaproteobacteria bacterium]
MGERIFLGVAAATFALYVLLAAPGVTWFDGGEFAAVIGSMGVSHPPGQPAFMVLGKLAALLPVGSLAFRLSMLSAGCAALAAGSLALLVSRATARLWGEPSGHAPLAGVTSGLLLGVSPGLALQGVRPELYGLALLLGLLAALAVQSGGRRGLALAVVPLCVAGAVHHAMLVAAVPGFFLLALGRGRGSLRSAATATLLLLPFGLLQFLWLPLRSMTRPEIDFGVARTFERVVMAATGASYARSYRLEPGQLTRNLSEHAAVFRADLGWFALALSVLSVLWLLWRVRPRPLLVAFVFVAAGVLPTALQGVFFPENPDAHGYLLGPMAVLAAGAGLGAWALVAPLRERSRTLSTALGVTLVIGAVAGPLSQTTLEADFSELESPRRLSAELLHDATPGALVLLGGDSWLMPALAARVWERRRPDLFVFGLHMLEGLALPDLAARSAAIPAGFTESERLAIGGAKPGLQHEHTLRAIVAHGPPVDVFVNDFFIAPELLAARQPHGLLLRLHAAHPDPSPDAGRTERAFDEEVLQGLRRGPGWTRDRVGREALSRRDLARGGLHLQRGERDLALRLWQRGSEIAPNPWDFVHLARHRLESGADVAGPWEADAQALEAADALLAGDFRKARDGVDAVLAKQPTHPVALLTAERLFTLGHHVSTATAAP